MAEVYDVRSELEAQMILAHLIREQALAVTRLNYNMVLSDQIPFMEMVHRRYFTTSIGPDEVGWPPLSQRTIRDKGHARILIDKSRLLGSLSGLTLDSIRRVKDNTLTFGTGVPYSIYHQQDCTQSTGSPVVGAVGQVLPVARGQARSPWNPIRSLFRIFSAVFTRNVAVKTVPVKTRRSSRGGRPRQRNFRRRRGGRVPARPHVGLTLQSINQIGNRMADAMLDKLKR